MTDICWEMVDHIIPQRNPEADKNAFGRILCVCGSAGYTGAAYFSVCGAVRMGGGVVTLATPEKAWYVLATKLNEPVVRPMPSTPEGLLSEDALPHLIRLAERADAILIGCGLGRSDAVTKIVRALIIEAKCQIVLDADGINAVCAHKDILRHTARPLTLTPHSAEFERLSGENHPSVEYISEFARDYHCVVLYKAHRTIIASPEGEIWRNQSGNPGMAKGGSGDVLAGMLVSLCGQGIPAAQAACAAAWLHGKAGDLAANELGEYGMTPSDMLECLPQILVRYNSREW